MASRALASLLGALCATLVFAAGCKSEIEKFPPPQPEDTAGAGGAPATTSSSGGASTGSGGASTGSGGGTTTTTGGVVNYCECGFEFTFDVGCGNCINTAFLGKCEAERQQCELDGPCTSLATCPQTCLQKPAAEQAACVRDCYVPFTDDSSHHLLAALLDCACANCAAACAPSQEIMCSE